MNNRRRAVIPIRLVFVSSQGSILLIALWSLSLLTIFAIYMGYIVNQKIALVDRLNSRNRLHFIAEAGVRQAISELKKKPLSEIDILNEPWSNNPSRFQEVGIGYGKFSVCYDYIEYESVSLQTRYGLMDEERKLNLNTEKLNVIQQLIMTITGLGQTKAQSLAASIVDWRDNDDDLSVPTGSAEDRYYRHLRIPYEAKDEDFQVFDELLLVRGMNQELLEQLKDYITIYSNGKININTVTAQVLYALNLDKNLVGKIISFRCGEDEIEATEDDNSFSSPSNITAELSEFVELPVEELARLSNLVAAGRITTSSDTFMIRVIAELDKQQSELICIVNREGKILSWREG